MGRVTYPHHVKANGRYYAPGEEIETNDVVDTKREQITDNRTFGKIKEQKPKRMD